MRKQFKQLHDLLYANQPEEKTLGPSDNSLVESAVSVGLKQGPAESCILKHRYVPWLEKATGAPFGGGFGEAPVRVADLEAEAERQRTAKADG